jgi:hypothetical protein
MTKIKFEAIHGYSLNQRFAFVSGLAVLTALFTFRRVHTVELLAEGFRVFRNVTFVYLTGGIFIAPEIYNPIMKNS